MPVAVANESSPTPQCETSDHATVPFELRRTGSVFGDPDPDGHIKEGGAMADQLSGSSNVGWGEGIVTLGPDHASSSDGDEVVIKPA